MEIPSKETESMERLKDVQITFLRGGEFFVNTKIYEKVPEEKIQRIREKLDDYTSYNAKREKGVATAITLTTLIEAVESIILKK